MKQTMGRVNDSLKYMGCIIAVKLMCGEGSVHKIIIIDHNMKNHRKSHRIMGKIDIKQR